MVDSKYRCLKCGSFEVIFVDRSSDPLDTKPSRFVCKKCGHIYDIDSGISTINKNTINTFPSPNLDLDVDDSLTQRIKSKKGVN